ncbi:hypothetical protein QIH80_20950 [Bradyrhizobium elkanii]|nr:hypothetical protein QIH80_20950 [Bradyrhizobium elkanii]
MPPRDLLLAIGIELPRLARCPCPVTLAARVALAFVVDVGHRDAAFAAGNVCRQSVVNKE